MTSRITTKIEREWLGNTIRGFVDNQEVIVVNDHILDTWGVASSTCLPGNLEEAKLNIECMNEVFRQVKSFNKFKRGVRVLVNQTSGFNKGATGVVEFVEPSGKQIWVFRDGSNGPMWFAPSELDVIG